MKLSKKLLGYILAIFLIKLTLVPFMKGVFILPDEGCILKVPEYLAQFGRLVNCSDVISTGGGSPPILTSILLSPIFLFLQGSTAYYGILVYNALLSALTAIPLYFIFKHYIKNEKIIFLFTTTTLLLPQILTYQYSTLSEIYFSICGIWFLYFYINSFKGDKAKRNKIISLILSLLAIGLRPFGFIILLAMASNEAFRVKNKKKGLLYIVLGLAASITFLLIRHPNILSHLIHLLNAFITPQGAYKLFHSILGQFNSYTMATFFIPLYLFISESIKKKPIHKEIRVFLISIFILNFFIAAQHMFGYFEKEIANTFIITRYINLTSTFIIIFGLIFLEKKKSLIPNTNDIFIFAFILLCFFGVNATGLNLQLNHDISYFFYADVATFFKYHSKLFLLFLFTLVFLNKKNTLRTSLVSIFIVLGMISSFTIYQFSYSVNKFKPVYDFLADKNSDVVFLMNGSKDYLEVSYWQTLLYSNNEVDTLFFDLNDLNEEGAPYMYAIRPRLEQQKRIENEQELIDYDYIVTPLDFTEIEKVYQFYHIKIYKTASEEL